MARFFLAPISSPGWGPILENERTLGTRLTRLHRKNLRALISYVYLLNEKFLQFDWLTAVVFQLNLKYLHVKITNLLWVVVFSNNSMIGKTISKYHSWNLCQISLQIILLPIQIYVWKYLVTKISIGNSRICSDIWQIPRVIFRNCYT